MYEDCIEKFNCNRYPNGCSVYCYRALGQHESNANSDCYQVKTCCPETVTVFPQDRIYEGLPGRDGKDGSSLEFAWEGTRLKVRLKGTEEWIYSTSLLGMTGPQGPQGEQGERGPKGDNGMQGIQGPQGPEGPMGLTGPEGPRGATGPQGPQGEKGDKGDRGDTGDRGSKGDKGDTGPQGPQGPRGQQGPQGDIGPAGYTPYIGDNGNWFINGQDLGVAPSGYTLPIASTTSLGGIKIGQGLEITEDGVLSAQVTEVASVIYDVISNGATEADIALDMLDSVNKVYQDYLNNKNSMINLYTSFRNTNSIPYAGIYTIESVTDTSFRLSSDIKILSKTRSNSGVTSNTTIRITCSAVITNGVVTSCSLYSGYASNDAYFLETNYNYTTPYEPKYDGSPATKKYVDDAIAKETLVYKGDYDSTIAYNTGDVVRYVNDSRFSYYFISLIDNNNNEITGPSTASEYWANINYHTNFAEKVKLSNVNFDVNFPIPILNGNYVYKPYNEVQATINAKTGLLKVTGLEINGSPAATEEYVNNAISGSGGISEIPIASETVLGGVKIGEGLSITEEGVLSAIGGSGTGASKVEIGDLAYTNSTTNEAASTATLTDNIENYDFIMVDVAATTTANDPRTLSPIIIHVPSLVAQGYYNSTTNKNLFHGMSGFLSGTTQHSVRVTLGFESGTYLSLVSAIPSAYQTAKLGKVYGIKLGSGGGGSSNIAYGTEDLVAGESPLETGTVYFVYE